jgi:hypothetical protein
LLGCSFLVCNFASTRFAFGVLAVVETFPLARAPSFVLVCAFALVDACFPTFVRFLVELFVFLAAAALAASRRFRATFEGEDFAFGLTETLLRLADVRPFVAPARAVLEADFCLEVAVAPAFFVDFLRAAIVNISTPHRRRRRNAIAPLL